MQIQRLEDIASFAVEEAKRLGATDSEIGVSAQRSSTVSVRFKKVEQLKGSEPRSLSLRVWVGKNSAKTTTSDFRRRPLTKLIRDTIEMARNSSPDETAGLPNKEDLATEFPHLDMTCDELAALPMKDKIEMALAAEAAAFATDSRIENARSISFSDSRTAWVYANSLDFVRGFERSSCSLSAAIIAKQGDDMQIGGWSHTSRKLYLLDSPESIGRTAAQRALDMLGGRKVDSQTVPVVFNPQVAAALVSHLVAAADGSAIYKRKSYLLDKIGQAVAGSTISITDDPFMPNGLGSQPFGTAGLKIAKRTIVKDGALSSYLINAYEGRKLGMRPNGGSSTNLFIENGATNPQDIISSVQNGLYLTKTSGKGFNVVTGDYSVGAAGRWIENGKLSYPVCEITIAGNMLEMFKSIKAVGNDLVHRSSVSAPTLLVAEMSVAGK
jgi:PmbA protein